MAQPSPVPSARKPKRTKLYLLLGVIVVVAVGVAAAMKRKGGEQATLVTFDKVVVRTITQTVSATGKIQPEVEVKIQPEVGGEITELPFKEGANVRKGELLVRLKPDNYRYQVEQQEASLAAARATALQSKAQLLKVQEDFKRSEDLFAKKLISDSQFVADKTALEVAQANLDNAEAQIRRTEGLLSQARDQLSKTAIFAPMDGTVSSRTSEVGERVAATGQYGGAEIMRVADLSSMEVRVNVNENDVVNVKVGDRARISIDAYPNRRFNGEVREIASAAKTEGLNTQQEVTNFQVKIRITDKDVALRPGMSANADIETQTVSNVLAVPIQSVTVRSREANKTIDQMAADRDKKAKETQGEGAAAAVNERQKREAERADREALQRVVFIRDGDKVKQVSVETGIADTTHMEIKSGVTEGQEIVSGSFTVITRTLKDGSAVRVEAPKPEAAK
ncbi:MAG TPA: efflux RND transporter periplasmic adaptor subunit [Opitutaceae bacterium]